MISSQPSGQGDQNNCPEWSIGGDAESLGSYVFRSPSGEVAIIYFRAYDFSSLLLKLFRRRCWQSTKTFDLTIGAENAKDATLFCEWLSVRVNMSYRPR